MHQDYQERVNKLGQAMDAALPSTQWSAAANEQAILSAIPAVKVAADAQDLPAYTAAMGGVCHQTLTVVRIMPRTTLVIPTFGASPSFFLAQDDVRDAENC